MAQTIPEKMRGLVTLKWAEPKEYTILNDLAVPKITKQHDILIKVAAASINPVDVKLASGLAKMVMAFESPYKIGLDVSGTIVAIGSSVKNFKVGDEVMSKVPMDHRGTFSEYCLSIEAFTVLKPSNLNHIDAASVPLVGLTALECLRWADSQIQGGLRGKTVLIPAGLSGTGSIAIQLALYHFEVAKVITTLSTQKMNQAEEFFGHETEAGTGGSRRGEMVYVDYKKEDILKKIPAHSVDFIYENQPVAMSYSSLLKQGAAVVSIAGVPSGTDMATQMPATPAVVKWSMNAVDAVTRWRFGRMGVKYRYIFMEPTHEMMTVLKEDCERGWIKPLVGRKCSLDDVEEVKKHCQEVFDGKGGIGKFVAWIGEENVSNKV